MRTREGGGVVVKALRAHAWHAKRWGGGEARRRARTRETPVTTKSRTQPIRERFGVRWRRAYEVTARYID